MRRTQGEVSRRPGLVFVPLKLTLTRISFPSDAVAELAEVLLSVQSEMLDQFSSFAEAASEDIALTEDASPAPAGNGLDVDAEDSEPRRAKRALADADTLLDAELESRHKR